MNYINLKNVKDGMLTKKSAEQACLSYMNSNRMIDLNDYDRYMYKVFPKLWKDAKPENDLMPAKDFPEFLQRVTQRM